MTPVHTRISFIAALLLTTGLSNAQESNSINNNIKNKTMTTIIQKNEEVVRNLYAQVLNKKNTASLKDYISEDYTGPQGVKGPAGFIKPIAPLIDAFPDIQWNIADLFGEGDEVAVRWK